MLTQPTAGIDRLRDWAKARRVWPWVNQVVERMRWRRTVVAGVPLWIRKDSPDLMTAEQTLGGDFRLLAALVPRFGLIVDAGGYIGTAAIALARMFPSATVVTVEPSRSNFTLLLRNVRPYRNIVALNKAVLAEPGKVLLKDRQTGPWGYTVVEQPADQPNARIIGQVESVTLGQLIDQYGRDGIDVLKLDVEGAEKAIFETSEEWAPRTTAVVVELHERISPGVEAAYLAATAGFDQLDTSGEKRVAIRTASSVPSHDAVR